ncbi:MAG: DUF1573 domain-containing protein [Flavobacteriales bacterium]|nr:DUF1573 domain-containing protein [Flavobacteriales bacterium]
MWLHGWKGLAENTCSTRRQRHSTIRFDSEGRSGLQEKTITVTGNTQPPTTVLLLKGDVVALPGATLVE